MLSAQQKKFILWTAATLGAAVLGALVNTVWSRARPQLQLLDVAFTEYSLDGLDDTLIYGPGEKVEVPARFRELILKSGWTQKIYIREKQVSLPTLRSALAYNWQYMQTLLEDISRYEEAKKEMEELVQEGVQRTRARAEKFFDFWERNDGFIYGSILGEYHKGNYQPENSKYDGEPFLLVRKDDDNDWIVSKQGGNYISYLAKKESRDELLQKEIAHALAFFDVDLLRSYLEIVARELNERDTAKSILDEIGKIRREFSRFRVTVLISNQGGRPVAFMPHATLVVDTTDLRLSGKAIRQPTVIPLTLMSDPESPEPILIGAGEAIIGTFLSDVLVKDIKTKDLLLQAYKIGAPKCRVKLCPASRGLFQPKTFRSAARKFSAEKYLEGQE